MSRSGCSSSKPHDADELRGLRPADDQGDDELHDDRDLREDEPRRRATRVILTIGCAMSLAFGAAAAAVAVTARLQHAEFLRIYGSRVEHEPPPLLEFDVQRARGGHEPFRVATNARAVAAAP